MFDRIKLLPDFEVKNLATSLNSSQKLDWGRELIDAKDFYGKTKGKGIKVCVIDTGAPRNHPDLEGAIVDTFNPYENEYPLDRCGHGSHVAGTIGARDNNIGTIGIAPECELLIAKGLDDDGFGDWAKIGTCIQWAVHSGAQIINMSLGDPNEPPEIIKTAIQWAASKGVIIVAAAGNDPNSDSSHPTINDVSFPARYEECIAVAAMDKDKKLAFFSHRGKALDAVAPGVDIYSTYKNNNYAILTGTSQAAPIISGILALLMAYKPDSIKNYKDAIKELSLISKNQEIVAEYTGNYNVGVPSFANVSIQSMNDDSITELDKDIVKDLETFDWKWEGNTFSSNIQDISWQG